MTLRPLPREIWAQAFCNLGRNDWVQLRRVSRTFNDIGAKLLFSSIRIFLFDKQGCPPGMLPDDEFLTLPDDQGTILQAERLSVRSWEILDYLTRNPKIAILIRTLTVYAFYTTQGIFECLCLANAIRKLPRLSTFRWLSGGAHLPSFVMETLPTNLTSLFVSRGPHELSRLRQLNELVIWHVHDDTISSFRDAMTNNTNTLRRLSLPPHLCARLPIRLFDNLTHLHMNTHYAPYHNDAELDLNFALRHTTRLESLSMPMHRGQEIIASLCDNGNALTNLVSLQLRFHYERLPPPDQDRLLSFLRERRRLRRLYLQFGESTNPAYCRKIFLLFKELPNLQVLGLNPCHLMLPNTMGVLQYSLADFLPPRLKAFHAKLPDQIPFSDHNLSFLRGLGIFNDLTYLDLILADPYRHLPFKPAELVADNLQLQLIGLDGDIYDVQAGVPVATWPAWKRILALPEDFEDEDHWWLHSISQAWRWTEMSLPTEYYS